MPLLFVLLLISVGVSGCAQSSDQQSSGAKNEGGVVRTGLLPRTGLFSGDTLKSLSIDDLVSRVEAGGVLVLGELHGQATHYSRQKLALEALSKTSKCTVSVGLEFLSWKNQTVIDQYFNGTVSESDFLRDAEWGGNPWDDYRDQALFPKNTGGKLIGLNAPRALTSAISRRGVAALTPEELQQMPPGFTLGSSHYRERFDVVMGGHVPATALDRYFAAQSTWDETMAWQAVEFLAANPGHCLAIIVGDFHVNFGGGLPDRLKARGVASVVTISQVETNGLSEEELTLELGPHAKYGSRADGVWLSSTIPTSPLKALQSIE